MGTASKSWGIVVTALSVLTIASAATAQYSGGSATAARAETGTYIFLPGQSTITQTGGIAGINRIYTITGTFQLTLDFEAGTASFDRMDANAVDDSPFRHTLDPNEVFNMTGLAGTIIDTTTIRFEGAADDGSSVRLTLTVLPDDTVTLKGETTPPPNSADFFIFALDAVAERKYSGGTGEPNDPYQIATAADLIALGETPADYDKHFILTADIDLDPKLPGRKVFDKAVIAPDTRATREYFQGTPFEGVFDGNGHTISHLTIKGKDYVGLFGQLSGEVKNVAVVDVNTTGSRDNVGGLVGANYYGAVTGCYSTGAVSGFRHNIGGLVGYNGGAVTDCNSTGTVTGGTNSVGGLVGCNEGAVNRCFSTSVVRGTESGVGGLVGFNWHGSVTRCYSTGAVNGHETVGGLLGSNEGDVTNCYSTGAVSSTGSWVGGLVGVNSRTVADCYSTGVVSSTGSGVGGLVGFNWQGPVTRCCSTGAVNGHHSVGGLVGFNEDAVTGCFSTGVVSGTGPGVGGLVGDNGRTVTDCYSSGAVSGSSHNIGGLMGYNEGAVTNCYSTGTVTGGTHSVGGLVGFNVSTVIASFWDTQTSGQAWSDGGTGLTPEEMRTARTFLDAGWDFVGETANGTEDVWKIAEGLGYPRLSWEKYNGGTGEPNDPYQIATAADLIALGNEPNDYDKHFVLTADIDLAPNLPGRKVFDKAVIAQDANDANWKFDGTPFTGLFDGNGHRISHLTISGGRTLGLFGELRATAEVKSLGVVDANITGSRVFIGGLVGWTASSCRVTQCYSSGVVKGTGGFVGGLVGFNDGAITQCYSTASVSGETQVGGLVGTTSVGTVTQCYSAGAVKGSSPVGGLMGYNDADGEATASFWDTQTSGQATSDGGTGKTTAEMQTAKTFLTAGWDFVGEKANGTEDLWWILEGKDYPRLSWQLPADDFADGKAGPLWMLYEPQPERVRLKEVNGRLEVEAIAQSENVDAIYAADGWRLDVTKEFAIQVDFHFSKQGGGDGRVTLGVVPSLDPSAMQWAEFEAGCFDTGPFYLYEVRNGTWVQEVVADRSSDGGTLYMSYDSDTDDLYLSYTGYGKAKA